MIDMNHSWNVFSGTANLSPMMCETTNNYRVPVQVPTEYSTDNKHVVHVGDMHIRVFTPDKLPDFIRVRLSMIKASGMDEPLTVDDRLTLSLIHI